MSGNMYSIHKRSWATFQTENKLYNNSMSVQVQTLPLRQASSMIEVCGRRIRGTVGSLQWTAPIWLSGATYRSAGQDSLVHETSSRFTVQGSLVHEKSGGFTVQGSLVQKTARFAVQYRLVHEKLARLPRGSLEWTAPSLIETWIIVD